MGIDIKTIFDLALSSEEYYEKFGEKHPLDETEDIDDYVYVGFSEHKNNYDIPTMTVARKNKNQISVLKTYSGKIARLIYWLLCK